MSTPPKTPPPPDIFMGRERRKRGHDFMTPDEINKEQAAKVDKKFSIKPVIPSPGDRSRRSRII